MTEHIPAWFRHLEDEDRQFVKRFILASGSLKELAEAYSVSYPTIRLRLNKLIERVRALDDDIADDPFKARLRRLVSSGELSTRAAKELLSLHVQILDGARDDG